jgi:hypothetical protein
MEISRDISIERVGDQWLALAMRDGVVFELTGPAATVIDCVNAGQPIPAACDDAAQALVDTGILTASTGWSRRRVLAAGGTAAAVGLITLSLPTAAMAASASALAAPTDVTASATAKENEVSVNWTNVSGATGYQVFYRTGTNAYQSFGDTLFTDGPVVVTGLTNASSYSFYIVATTSGSTSPDSLIATAVPGSWTSRTSAADNLWNSVTYGNGLFVAVASTGTNNRVMTSPDGEEWTIRTSAANNEWRSVTYGMINTDPAEPTQRVPGFVAVASTGTNNRVMTSPDGITWTIGASAADNNWRSVTYGNGLFVAVASSGIGDRVMTSPDGITWTTQISTDDYTWNSVTYGNDLFVAVASSGTGDGNGNRRVMTSPDGITWTTRTSPFSQSWNSVAHGNGLFVAVSGSGTTNNRVMSSPDGTSWTAQSPAANLNWTGVTYGLQDGNDNKPTFVAVANDGTNNRVMTKP